MPDLSLIKAICSLIFIILILPLTDFAQKEIPYDEIPVTVMLESVGTIELPAVIQNEDVFLPVTDIFDFLKIRNTPSPGLDSITGFFITQKAEFLIDGAHYRIVLEDKKYTLSKSDFIRTETNLYLKSNFFKEIFGLDCKFSMRSLSVIITTKLDLPVLREMRQDEMRRNISRLKGDIRTDTTYPRRYPFFHFGVADWSVIATQQLDSVIKTGVHGPTDTRVNLGLGGMLAGGEADVSLNYSTSVPFTERQQYYFWRYVNNDFAFLRQAIAGKIVTQATSSIYAPVLGVQLTNTPTTYRRSFGSYRLSDHTQPNWIVELYVNNVLVDYVKADASGFFTFDVPMVYGNSQVKLRFYSPWGEEKSKEQSISIPFNFLPPREIEYSLSAGLVEDGNDSKFSRAVLNYGLNRRITIGGGLEYLSSVTSGAVMPFVNFSARLASSLLLTGEYMHNVRWKGTLSYRLPFNLQFELDYFKYHEGQTAINNNYLEERKAVVSWPIQTRFLSAFMRLTVDQIVLPTSQYTSSELLFSGSILGVTTNFTTYALFTNPSTPYIYSNLSLSFRFPKGFTFTPQVQYEYDQYRFVSMKAELEKTVGYRGFLNLSYEQNFLSNIKSLQLGFRYNFSFAATGMTARQTNAVTYFVESASGSLLFDRKSRYIGASRVPGVGRGGIAILPYLDMNCNGKRDPDEPKAMGLNVRINGGKVVISEKDTIIRIFELEPYTKYIVFLDRNNFDNISWQIRQQTLKVAIDPNQLKMIEVPIAVVGEASGMIYFYGPRGKAGLGRILLNIFNSDSILVARTLSEEDGYFSYLGLAPGTYTARIDDAQLRKLRMSASPPSLPLTVKKSREGDIIDGLEFTLQPLQADTSRIRIPHAEGQVTYPKPNKENLGQENQVIPPVKEITKPAPAKQVVPEKVEPKKPEQEVKQNVIHTESQVPQIQPGSQGIVVYYIQVGAFSREANAARVLRKVSRGLGKPIEIKKEDGLFKVQITGFSGMKEAQDFIPVLEKKGFGDSIILNWIK